MILDNLSNEEFDAIMNKAVESYEKGECVSIEDFEKEIERQYQ